MIQKQLLYTKMTDTKFSIISNNGVNGQISSIILSLHVFKKSAMEAILNYNQRNDKLLQIKNKHMTIYCKANKIDIFYYRYIIKYI